MECNKEEALRAKEITEKKFEVQDFVSARKLIVKAQQLYPALDNVPQMLAVCDVHSVAQAKLNGCDADWEPWLIDGKRFATKIKNPSFDPLEENDPFKEDQKSVVTRECPNCSYQINNSDLAQKWPGLPAGVKFDPSDQELLGHLAAKVGMEIIKPNPFIDEFIPTLQGDDGICYTHPENLPGVKQDGSVCHFFHRTANAYLRGNRKRRKINCGDNQNGVEASSHKTGKVRWHKTGKTRSVIENGIQRGWKKIMVLYMNNGKGGKDEKTNWVMHQYHLGTEEDEKDSEFVVSKIFYQQQSKHLDRNEILEEVECTLVTIGDPVTPKTSTPELPRHGKWQADLDTIQEEHLNHTVNPCQVADLDVATHQTNVSVDDLTWNGPNDQADVKFDDSTWEPLDDPMNLSLESAWFAGESQLRIDSQPLDELLFCDENLPISSDEEKLGSEDVVPGLAEHGRIEAEGLTIQLPREPDSLDKGCDVTTYGKDLAYG
ncbi:hypothetical protein KI387_038702, partial [Taxus chinensis]